MTVEWIGKYRSLVAAIIRHGNIYSRFVYLTNASAEADVSLTLQQWQLLEYLVENPDDTHNMAYISDRLGTVVSSFSKYVAVLVKAGLVAKFQTTGNKKNVILRITEKGEAYYYRKVESRVGPMFSPFFKALENVDVEQLDLIAHAIDLLTNSMITDENKRDDLVKIE